MSVKANSRTQTVSAGKPVAIWRFGVLLLFALVLMGGVSSRAVFLHVFDQEHLGSAGDARSVREIPIVAYRGMITDRNGQPLAVSTPLQTIWIEPGELQEKPGAWQALAKVSGWSVNKVRDLVVANKQKGFVYFLRHLPPAQAERILALQLPGVHSLVEYRRYYPAGEVASHLVGFTNIDDQGQEGLELAFNEQLKGSSGKRRILKDLRGRMVQDLELVAPARNGENLVLSVDLRAQYIAYRELLAAVKKHHAKGGSVVALDVHTGEILAMVNQPAFNPNDRSSMKSKSLRNRAVTDVFEPGSTMKPLTVATALESGNFKPGSLLDTSPGKMRIGKYTIRDHRDYGLIDVETVLTKSSNIGASKLALALDEGLLSESFYRFGLGSDTGSYFPGESSGVMPDHAKWRDIETATLSYGYGLSVTALQLANSYAVIANGGIKRNVSLLKLSEASVGERVLSEKIARQVVSMLETVVGDKGTGSRARVPGYRIAGKTGTVHKAKSGGYSDDNYVSLFVGMAPASNPKVVIAVVIDDPQGEQYYGGAVAAPAFAKIASGMMQLLGIAPDEAPNKLLVDEVLS